MFNKFPRQDHDLTVYAEEKDLEDEEIQKLARSLNSNRSNEDKQRLRPFIHDKLNHKFTGRCQSSPVPMHNIVSSDVDVLLVGDDYDVANMSEEHLSDEMKIDFVICLGGDGVLLHASTIFQVFDNSLF